MLMEDYTFFWIFWMNNKLVTSVLCFWNHILNQVAINISKVFKHWFFYLKSKKKYPPRQPSARTLPCGALVWCQGRFRLPTLSDASGIWTKKENNDNILIQLCFIVKKCNAFWFSIFIKQMTNRFFIHNTFFPHFVR